jgi:hypothetical protein
VIISIVPLLLQLYSLAPTNSYPRAVLTSTVFQLREYAIAHARTLCPAQTQPPSPSSVSHKSTHSECRSAKLLQTDLDPIK